MRRGWPGPLLMGQEGLRMGWVRAEVRGGGGGGGPYVSCRRTLVGPLVGHFRKQSIFPASWGSGELGEKVRGGHLQRWTTLTTNV